MKGPLFYSKILLFGEYGIIKDSKGLSIPYSFYNGALKMDNNLIENKVRPMVIGRKNYLFAGSHNGAERAAMFYSFFGTCKMHNINPHQWLKYVLENINSEP